MISAVVPVYNDAPNLRACLLALRASALDPFELLVVDDASSDDSVDVALEFGARVLRQTERRGPAAARNRGAAAAQGEYLLFVDADVCVRPEAAAYILAAFAADPGAAALFGSYDQTPRAANLFSQYKNLLHHFVHQQGLREASTFWSGCGAIRRTTFLELGGFDESYARPCIEDIELGLRLRRAGKRILLCKEVQATHLKHWTFRGLVTSDFRDRALPWAALILRERRAANDLNLGVSQRVSLLLAWALAGLFVLGAWRSPQLLLGLALVALSLLALDAWSARYGLRPWSALPVALTVAAALAYATFVGWPASLLGLALLAALVLLNAPLYAFFARTRNWLFSGVVLPLQLLYYLYGGLAVAVALARHVWSLGFQRRQTGPTHP